MVPPGAKEATTTLHVLTLLRDLLPCLPASSVKPCCETLLRVMTLSHVVSFPCPLLLLWLSDTVLALFGRGVYTFQWGAGQRALVGVMVPR